MTGMTSSMRVIACHVCVMSQKSTTCRQKVDTESQQKVNTAYRALIQPHTNQVFRVGCDQRACLDMQLRRRAARVQQRKLHDGW